MRNPGVIQNFKLIKKHQWKEKYCQITKFWPLPINWVAQLLKLKTKLLTFENNQILSTGPLFVNKIYLLDALAWSGIVEEPDEPNSHKITKDWLIYFYSKHIYQNLHSCWGHQIKLPLKFKPHSRCFLKCIRWLQEDVSL